MTTEISINTIGDAVRERVKKAIFDSIPDEAIENLIKKELEALTNEKDRWGSSQKSPLSSMIEKELKEQICNKIKDSVSVYIDETYVNNSKELVDKAIKELAPIFMASAMEKFASASISELRNQLYNKGIFI